MYRSLPNQHPERVLVTQVTDVTKNCLVQYWRGRFIKTNPGNLFPFAAHISGVIEEGVADMAKKELAEGNQVIGVLQPDSFLVIGLEKAEKWRRELDQLAMIV